LPKPVADVPFGGTASGPPGSVSVPKIDSVPSRLSITSTSRLCCGQSAVADVLTSHQFPPAGQPSSLPQASTLFSCVCPAT
jgi:hypothetical protein